MKDYLEYQKGWDAYMASQPFASHTHTPDWQVGYLDAQDFDLRCKIADQQREAQNHA